MKFPLVPPTLSYRECCLTYNTTIEQTLEIWRMQGKTHRSHLSIWYHQVTQPHYLRHKPTKHPQCAMIWRSLAAMILPPKRYIPTKQPQCATHQQTRTIQCAHPHQTTPNHLLHNPHIPPTRSIINPVPNPQHDNTTWITQCLANL